MRCPPCTSTQPGTCSAMFQHEGMAVVNRGTGLHMPLDEQDIPPPFTVAQEMMNLFRVAVIGGAVTAMLAIAAGFIYARYFT